MTHLRSPAVHHLDLEPWSLRRYAGKTKQRQLGTLSGKYGKPALSLFNAHCEKVIETFRLRDIHISDRVTACKVECDEVFVQLASGLEVNTQNLVLAMGAGDQPYWPPWAIREDSRVHHIFDTDFHGWPTSKETVAVVGGEHYFSAGGT